MRPAREGEIAGEAEDSVLSLGDRVTLSGMPENSGLNGTYGTLMKVMGKDRWVVKVDKDDKTKVVTTKNLTKVAGPPAKYSIIGTWDEWEPHEMTWNDSKSCFEGIVTIGKSGQEDFRFLQDADWSKCVYPDLEKASLWDDYTVRGPNEDDANTEWTIGRHPNDRTFAGAKYTVQLFVSADGKPLHVGWESHNVGPTTSTHEDVKADERGKENHWNTQVEHLEQKHTKEEQKKIDTVEVSENTLRGKLASSEELHDNISYNEGKAPVNGYSAWLNDHKSDEDDSAAWTWDRNGGLVWKQKAPELEPESDPYVRAKQQEDEVVDAERKARERLEMRLAQAAQLEKLAITDSNQANQQETEVVKQDKKAREAMACRAFEIQMQSRAWNNSQFMAMARNRY